MEPTEHVPSHDHYALLYSTRSEQFDAVTPYIRDGLDADAKCIYVASENAPSDVLDALDARGVDVDAAIESGQLSVLDSHDVFPEDDGVDADRLVEILESAVEDALADGYDRVRTTGEMSWTLDHAVDPGVLAEFEAKLNRIDPDSPWTILCQYNRDRFSPAVLDDALGTHPRLLDGSDWHANVYYHEAGASETATITQKLERIADESGSPTPPGELQGVLVAINNAAQKLADADEEDIYRLVVDASVRALDRPYVSLWTFDSSTGELRPRHTRSEIDGSTDIASKLSDRAWNALRANEPRQFDRESSDCDATSAGDSVLSGAIFPIGTYGVLVVGSTASAGLNQIEFEFAEAIATNTQTVLEKSQYERSLFERDAELAARDERIERLRRIVSAFQGISRVLVDASTRSEILESVCDRLAAVGFSEFVWIGTLDPETDAVTPRYRAGNGQGYLDAVAADDRVDRELTAEAARTGEIRRAETVRTGTPLEHWQMHALKRGFQSAVSLPLVGGGSRYGVLSVYGNAPATFDEEVTAVLEEIRDLVVHALAAVEQKRALVSDGVTEIELLVRDEDHPAVRLVSEADCRLELEGVTHGADRGVHTFARVRGAEPEQVRAVARRSETVEDVTVVREAGSGRLYRCTLADSGVTPTLLDRGAVPRDLVAEDDEARLTVHCPKAQSVREVVDAFTATYPDSELLARRELDRPVQSDELWRSVEDKLSDRQLEIVKTAYFSGYFEWPRERTGEEVAQSLDVSQPTVNRHLRAAQRALFSRLFDDE